jgi:hypothetical protein
VRRSTASWPIISTTNALTQIWYLLIFQIIGAMPPCLTPGAGSEAGDFNDDMTDDVEMELKYDILADQLEVWRSDVSCIGCQLVQLTANIRTNPVMVENQPNDDVELGDGDVMDQANSSCTNCKLQLVPSYRARKSIANEIS